MWLCLSDGSRTELSDNKNSQKPPSAQRSLSHSPRMAGDTGCPSPSRTEPGAQWKGASHTPTLGLDGDTPRPPSCRRSLSAPTLPGFP